VVAYGADKLVKHSTDGIGFGSFIVSYSISDAAWKKLPLDVQKAMIAVADEIIPSACQEIQKADETTRNTLAAAGVHFEPLQPEKFKDLLKGVAKTWADGLDSRGKRGSDALREFDAMVATVPAR
jgi:TRAP-type C4-dicarboxylate transport system substrate-binding protein